MSARHAPDQTDSGFDWSVWREAFDLRPTALWQAREAFPAIAAATGQGRPPLTRELLLALASPAAFSDVQEAFDWYLDIGELGAASALVPASASEGHADRLLQRIAERRDELDLDFNRELAKFEALHSRLVLLGERASADLEHEARRERVIVLRNEGRIGPSIALSREYSQSLLQELEASREQLEAGMAQLRDENSSARTRVREAVLRQLERAEYYRDIEADDLARQAVDQAREMLQMGATALPAVPADAAMRLRLRFRFPSQVRATHIRTWFERGERPAVPGVDWLDFVRGWLPSEWQQVEARADPVYQAIERLASLANNAPTVRGGMWVDFLKDLFDLLGRRNQQPRELRELLLRPLHGKRTRVGFWVGHCQPTLEFSGTFLDPSRVGPEGLPLVIWHQPREPRCPRPRNLELELEKLRLRDRPLVVLADQPVDPEERQDLRQALPSAALLDETDLLRIILSPPDVTSDDTAIQIRQIHFAAAVSSQLPAPQASPFVESGPTTTTMFFGRAEVVREFRDPNGPRILYGGRRLGKSSMFHELRRRFVKDDPVHNAAIYHDCATAGMTEQSILLLVQSIADNINRYTPPPEGHGPEMPFRGRFPRPASVADLLESLRTLLREHDAHRLLLLLDEADTLCEFLDVPNTATLTDAQQLGWDLRTLINEFPERFDVRLAGFQEIQRTTTSTSGPFYNFGRGQSSFPLKVFTPEEATKMLVSTLQCLAVEFADSALVDRILLFTGRHPALLQEFGRKLYFEIRKRPGRPPWTVRAEDVDAVMLDPDFRKRVVDTIHLNVNRETRAQRILRLLLYLWVQQIVAPQGGSPPQEARTARDLFDLIGRILGSEAQVRLDVSSIEAYLRDLEVLGVLERRGTAYVFAYRAFATLLYHDYFMGGLSSQTLQDAWSRIENASPTRRLWMTTETGHTISPLTAETQERLVDEGERPILLLGAAGTGLTTLGHWLAQQPPTRMPGLQVLCSAAHIHADSSDGLRQGLANALEVHMGADWPDFAQIALARVSTLRESPVLHSIVLDPVDSLAESDDSPLFFWEEDETALGYRHVFDLLARLIVASEGRLRFVCTGGVAAARLWVDNVTSLAEVVARGDIQRLDQAGCSAWLEASRLLVPNDQVRALVWEGTRGDWRLLSALQSWLRRERPQGEVVMDQDRFRSFVAVLQDSARRQHELPDLARRLLDPALDGLRVIVQVAAENAVARWSIEDLAEFCLLHVRDRDDHTSGWSDTRWKSEARALALLQELREELTVGTDSAAVQILVDADDPWLALLRP